MKLLPELEARIEELEGQISEQSSGWATEADAKARIEAAEQRCAQIEHETIERCVAACESKLLSIEDERYDNEESEKLGEGTYANIMLASAITAIRALAPTTAEEQKPTSALDCGAALFPFASNVANMKNGQSASAAQRLRGNGVLPFPDEDGHCERCGLAWPDEKETLEAHECPPGFRPPTLEESNRKRFLAEQAHDERCASNAAVQLEGDTLASSQRSPNESPASAAPIPTPWPDKERGIIEGLEIAAKIADKTLEFTVGFSDWFGVKSAAAIRAEIERRAK